MSRTTPTPMSSRRESQKRLKPRNKPYKRDRFNKTEYLLLPAKAPEQEQVLGVSEDEVSSEQPS